MSEKKKFFSRTGEVMDDIVNINGEKLTIFTELAIL